MTDIQFDHILLPPPAYVQISDEVANVNLLKTVSVMLLGAIAMCSGAAVFAQEDTSANTTTQKKQLRIATWGGAYGKSQQAAILNPAAETLGITLARVEAKRNELADADVLEVTQAELVKGCADGRLAKLDTSQLQDGVNQETADKDFFDGALTKCSVASMAWSALILVNEAKFKSRVPKTVADAFNTKRFPGKRALIKKPENLFEFAAIATGSAPQMVYADLENPNKLQEVMKRLEAVLPHIIWVGSQSAALEKLGSGEAVFAMGYSGRAFRKIVAGNITALWNAHVYDFTSWAVSAGASDPKMAASFIALATSPDYLAAHARLWPYGPMRKSAVENVGRHATLDIDLAPYMPTSKLRYGQAIRYDAAFWAKNGTVLNNRLQALIEGFPLGQRVPPPVRRPQRETSAAAAETATSDTN